MSDTTQDNRGQLAAVDAVALLIATPAAYEEARTSLALGAELRAASGDDATADSLRGAVRLLGLARSSYLQWIREKEVRP